MPDLVGKRLGEVSRTLALWDIEVGEVHYQSLPGLAAGTVLEHSPAAGDIVLGSRNGRFRGGPIIPMIQIAPSILAADFAALGEQVRTVEDAGAHLLHLDVMDGHFVPNITLGPPVVASIRKITRLPLDVHLMIEKPDAYIEAFADAGADWISVHAEACAHLDRTLNRIRSRGLSTGVVLNPATSLSVLENVLSLVDFVLIMSVNPGFGAQKFIPYSLQKIEELRKMIDRQGLSVKIEADGGVSLDNLCPLVRSGAEVLVAGSQIFGSPDPGAVVRQMIDRSAGCFEGGQDGAR